MPNMKNISNFNGLVIYSAIANNYDYLRKLPKSLKGVTCICFSNKLPNGFINGWIVKPFPNDIEDPTRRCRDIKINPHIYLPNYKYSLWVDANIQIKDGIVPLLNSLICSNTKIAGFRHPKRSCVYDEGEACKILNKDTHEVIDRQMNFLKKQEYPKQAGLIETNVLFRLHNDLNVIKAMNLWSDLLKNFSKRDQLSINYALWESELKFKFIPGSARGDNPAFIDGMHRGKGNNLYAFLEAYSYRNIFLNSYS